MSAIIKCSLQISLMCYPSRSSAEFCDKISRKAEFRELLDHGHLYPHQELLRRYMSPHTPYDKVLVYHSMGTGKTFACIAIAEDHFSYNGKKCVVLTKGLTSRNSYISQIICWLRKKDADISKKSIRAYISARYIFSHHISFCKYRLMRDTIDPSICDNIVLVIDEVHNLSPSTRSNPNPMYDSLVRYIAGLTNSRVMLLSGTPLVNDAKKILSILSMILPTDIHIDDDSFHDRVVLSDIAAGYVSYHHNTISDTKVYYNGVTIPGIKYPIRLSCMSGIQRDTYIDLYNSNKTDAIYNNSVNASLFVFSDGTYGSSIKDKLKVRDMVVNEFISAFMGEKRVKYRYRRYTIDVRYTDDISIDNLRHHSCKYHDIITQIVSRTDQCCFVFIKEVVGSGLLLFSAILESLGYELYYGQDLSLMSKRRRYTICVGDENISSNNKDRICGFNNRLNRYGDYVQVMLGSSVMSESISLLNVRHFHTASPHWNDSVIEQAMRRVIRSRSHDDLESCERFVDIFLHASYINDDIESVDMRKLSIAQDKEDELDPLRDNLRQISIENILDTHPIHRADLDCSTYIRYIDDAMLREYVRIISDVVDPPMTLHRISRSTLLPIDVVKYVISECVYRGICVRDYYGRRSYIRECRGIVTLTRNFTLYHTDLDTSSKVLVYRLDSSIPNIFSVDDFIRAVDVMSDVEIIYKMSYLSWDRRISVIERCIEYGNNISQIFSLYIIGKTHHLYNYRRPTTGSYKSMLVGIRPSGLSRRLHNESWNYVTDMKYETILIDIYHASLDELRVSRSRDNRLYTLSTTDMIVRMATVGESHKDRRRYKRGRDISTLPRDVIDDCCLSIVGRITTIDHLVSSLVESGILIYV